MWVYRLVLLVVLPLLLVGQNALADQSRLYINFQNRGTGAKVYSVLAIGHVVGKIRLATYSQTNEEHTPVKSTRVQEIEQIESADFPAVVEMPVDSFSKGEPALDTIDIVNLRPTPKVDYDALVDSYAGEVPVVDSAAIPVDTNAANPSSGEIAVPASSDDFIFNKAVILILIASLAYVILIVIISKATRTKGRRIKFSMVQELTKAFQNRSNITVPDLERELVARGITVRIPSDMDIQASLWAAINRNLKEKDKSEQVSKINNTNRQYDSISSSLFQNIVEQYVRIYKNREGIKLRELKTELTSRGFVITKADCHKLLDAINEKLKNKLAPPSPIETRQESTLVELFARIFENRQGITLGDLDDELISRGITIVSSADRHGLLAAINEKLKSKPTTLSSSNIATGQEMKSVEVFARIFEHRQRITLGELKNELIARHIGIQSPMELDRLLDAIDKDLKDKPVPSPSNSSAGQESKSVANTEFKPLAPPVPESLVEAPNYDRVPTPVPKPSAIPPQEPVVVPPAVPHSSAGIGPQFAIYFAPNNHGELDNNFAAENPIERQYMLRTRTRSTATEGELSLSIDHPAQEVRPFDIAQNRDGLLSSFIEADGFGNCVTVLANGTVRLEGNVWVVVEKIKASFS